MLAAAQRIEPDQFTRQVEADDLLMSVFVEAHRLECAGSRDEQCGERIAQPE